MIIIFGRTDAPNKTRVQLGHQGFMWSLGLQHFPFLHVLIHGFQNLTTEESTSLRFFLVRTAASLILVKVCIACSVGLMFSEHRDIWEVNCSLIFSLSVLLCFSAG